MVKQELSFSFCKNSETKSLLCPCDVPAMGKWRNLHISFLHVLCLAIDAMFVIQVICFIGGAYNLPV